MAAQTASLSRNHDFTSLDKYSADQDEAIRLQEILARLRDLPKPILPDWEYFQSRELALGLCHEDATLVPFTVLRGKMLEQLIECDSARSQETLLDYLKLERQYGAGKVPEWYDPDKLKNRLGYQRCGCRTCFHSETLEKQFDSCPHCKKIYYCRSRCREKDWRLRHENECEGLAKKRARKQLVQEGAAAYGSFLQSWKRAVFG